MMRITTLAALLLFAASPAFAAGEETPATATTCKTGEVWDKVKSKCVKAASGVLPDGELYEQGRQLAKNGSYDDAIAVLSLVKDQRDPRVLNYLGYSNRKAGRIDVGIAYYQQALAIDPDFVLVREYLGEGYVAAGRIDLARFQLAEIGKRCGTACEEYAELAEAIVKATN